MYKKLILLCCLMATIPAMAQQKSLHQVQQEFEDLQFGLFTHFALPTYVTADWSDPDLSPEVFNPTKLDCSQWAKAAKSANMTFGCISVKHHNGFCLWDTKTTDYQVMSSPLKRDLLKEYVDAFHKAGLKVMLHYSILDTHHRLRANMITPDKVEMIKQQLRELLTNYGPITAIIFDGYEAPWGRISYEDVPFQDLYALIKSIQPECLVLDMNSAKYPREALFYGDIKFYEQGAGQKISTTENRLPAMACLPLQRTWFWKTDMPTGEIRDPKQFVEEVLDKYPEAHCSFVLNAAPNRDGLIDDNALKALKEIGRLWKKKQNYPVPECDAPIVERNIAKGCPAESSWSDDTSIMDYANDDDFGSAWRSAPDVKKPWWSVDLGRQHRINQVVITEPRGGVITNYTIEVRENGAWKTVFSGVAKDKSRVKNHTFPTVRADRVRVTINASNGAPALAEVGVYEEY